MGSAADKARGERAIFRMFAQVSGLPVRMRSIVSRQPPEPDIRCLIDGIGHIAFELGEVLGQPFASATYARAPLSEQFRSAYASLPDEKRERIEAALGGTPTVFVGYRPGIPPGKWKKSIEPILGVLSERTDLLPTEDFPVWMIPNLRGLVDEMKVQGARRPAHPGMHVMEATQLSNSTLVEILKQKFGKAYSGDIPRELLLYYALEPPFKRPRWLDSVEQYATKHISASPFRRLWIYDHFDRTVCYVSPL